MPPFTQPVKMDPETSSTLSNQPPPIDLWPCDEHLQAWYQKRTEKQKGKRKREDAPADVCECGPAVSRDLCRQFFEANRSLWPMLWKNGPLRATVAVCEQRGMQHLELDAMDPEICFHSFFKLARGALWSSVPSVDEYWRYMRRVPLYTDMSRPLDGLIGWHTLAACPAGALAVILNDTARKQHDPVLYLWVPVVPAETTGSLFWTCHFGTLIVAHKDWTSSSYSRGAWDERCFQAKYEWSRASKHVMDDAVQVLRLSLVRFEDERVRSRFTHGRNRSGGQPSDASKALKPRFPFLVHNDAGSSPPRFAKDMGALASLRRIEDWDKLHERCTREWVSHAEPWRGTLSGLLSPHAPHVVKKLRGREVGEASSPAGTAKVLSSHLGSGSDVVPSTEESVEASADE